MLSLVVSAARGLELHYFPLDRQLCRLKVLAEKNVEEKTTGNGKRRVAIWTGDVSSHSGINPQSQVCFRN